MHRTKSKPKEENSSGTFGTLPSEGSDSFRTTFYTIPESIRQMERASSVIQAGPAGPWLQRYAKVWQINHKGGVEAKDYLKGASDTVRAITSFINNCNANCDARAIVDGIFGLFMAPAFVIGAAFPPVGIAMTIIGAIGSLVSAIWLGPTPILSRLDTTVTPNMIQDAVDRALTSFTVRADVETLRAFRTFFNTDIDNYVSFVGQLGYIMKTDPSGQATVDRQINLWFTQQYSPAWTGVYLRALLDMESRYTTWFGADNASGIRARLKQWKASV